MASYVDPADRGLVRAGVAATGPELDRLADALLKKLASGASPFSAARRQNVRDALSSATEGDRADLTAFIAGSPRVRAYVEDFTDAVVIQRLGDEGPAGRPRLSESRLAPLSTVLRSLEIVPHARLYRIVTREQLEQQADLDAGTLRPSPRCGGSALGSYYRSTERRRFQGGISDWAPTTFSAASAGPGLFVGRHADDLLEGYSSSISKQGSAIVVLSVSIDDALAAGARIYADVGSSLSSPCYYLELDRPIPFKWSGRP